MKERCDGGSQYQNLRKGKRIQERLARRLHQEAGVPGPMGSKNFKHSKTI